MKATVALNKPTLKMVKIADVERPVIQVTLIMPYTAEAWGYVGARAGEALNASFAAAQREMFDAQTGEIIDRVVEHVNSGALDTKDVHVTATSSKRKQVRP